MCPHRFIPIGLFALICTFMLLPGTIRKLIRAALREFGSHVEDEVPAAIVERHGLMRKNEAIAEIHEPGSIQGLRLTVDKDSTPARYLKPID